MKTVYISLLLLLLNTACTTNNGDIGPLMGTWQLDSVNPDTDSYNGRIFWKFQSQIIEIVEADPQWLEYESSWGTWALTDQTLTLSFTSTDISEPDGQYKYAPPQGIGLSRGENPLKIITLTSTRLTLQTHEGITLSLHKI